MRAVADTKRWIAVAEERLKKVEATAQKRLRLELLRVSQHPEFLCGAFLQPLYHLLFRYRSSRCLQFGELLGELPFELIDFLPFCAGHHIVPFAAFACSIARK